MHWVTAVFLCQSASKLFLALQHLKSNVLDKEYNFLLREQLLWGQNGCQKVFLFNISRWSVVTQKEINNLSRRWIRGKAGRSTSGITAVQRRLTRRNLEAQANKSVSIKVGWKLHEDTLSREASGSVISGQAGSPGKIAMLTAFGVSPRPDPRESKGWSSTRTRSLPGRKTWGLEHQCYMLDKHSPPIHQVRFSLWSCYLSCTTRGPLSLLLLLVPLKLGKTVLWALVNKTVNSRTERAAMGAHVWTCHLWQVFI